jgi:hypothetical protein
MESRLLRPAVPNMTSFSVYCFPIVHMGGFQGFLTARKEIPRYLRITDSKQPLSCLCSSSMGWTESCTRSNHQAAKVLHDVAERDMGLHSIPCVGSFYPLLPIYPYQPSTGCIYARNVLSIAIWIVPFPRGVRDNRKA